MNVSATGAAAAAGMIAVALTFGTGSAVSAPADPKHATFGTQQQVTDGAEISAYTVVDLRPSARNTLDVPLRGNVPLSGKLWEATTTVTAVRGSVIPAMQMFNARAADGANYHMLEETLAPDLSVSPMAQGGQMTGKIYFDVTGAAPTEVVYDDPGKARLVWAG
jgi:hypothetical protein